ncbi:olfactory receptor 502-like [Xenopus laevis]|uniref:Olfactory receptor 502-like n=1 Tax=Xenopus laevis TaxID=8355 RepID=A0A8J1LNC4_XENLA|nr:olfactory receptor 502-like [Xenopus laevis]
MLLIYITCVSGDLSVIFLVRTEPSLHTPMYIFISTLAATEMMFVTSIIPNLLANLIAGKNRISFIGCFTQLFVTATLGTAQCYFLAVMAFDRNLAISNPLHYSSIMTQTLCVQLAILPWIVGIIYVSIPFIFTAMLDFCGPNEVNHFFCDFAPLQSLACSDPFIAQVLASSGALFAVVLPFIITVGFYIHIIIIIAKINSAESKQKAFSTCSSHLTVAGLDYLTSITVYVVPKGSRYDRYLALIFTFITPLLNPFIYTFRNKDVKRALFKSRRLKLWQGSF